MDLNKELLSAISKFLNYSDISMLTLCGKQSSKIFGSIGCARVKTQVTERLIGKIGGKSARVVLKMLSTRCLTTSCVFAGGSMMKLLMGDPTTGDIDLFVEPELEVSVPQLYAEVLAGENTVVSKRLSSNDLDFHGPIHDIKVSDERGNVLLDLVFRSSVTVNNAWCDSPSCMSGLGRDTKTNKWFVTIYKPIEFHQRLITVYHNITPGRVAKLQAKGYKLVLARTIQ